MNTIHIITNQIVDPETGAGVDADFFAVSKDPARWIVIKAEDTCQALRGFFGASLPPTARIYFQTVSADHDVTPADLAGIKRLQALQGHFYVIVYPAGEFATIIIATVVAILAVALTFLFTPPVPTARNTQSSSPNNELSSRTNEARPMGRIPDIFGEVNATPDMIGVPCASYVDHVEVEDWLGCVGRGAYTIYNARDGETSLREVPGTSLQVYRPFARVNTDGPYFAIGTAIPDQAIMATRSNSINGQTLRAPNEKHYQGERDLVFKYPNIVMSDADFEEIFAPGDVVTLTGGTDARPEEIQSAVYPWSGDSFLVPYVDDDQLALYANASSELIWNNAIFWGQIGTDVSLRYDLSGTYAISQALKITKEERDYIQVSLTDPGTVNATWLQIAEDQRPSASFLSFALLVEETIRLDGDYTVVSVSGNLMTFSDPAAINADWNRLQALPGEQLVGLSSLLVATGPRWIGPFTLEEAARTSVHCNFVAMNGLYKDDGKKQQAVTVTIELEITPVDKDGLAIGNAETFTTEVRGSAATTDTRARTLNCSTTFQGRCTVRARRVTESNLDYKGSFVDEVQWRDLYAIATLPEESFGNCTMLRMRQVATTGALALKERKLNMLVCREIPLRIAGNEFTTELYPSKDAAEIFTAVALDPYQGGRPLDEIDFDNIYDTIAAVKAYFGTAEAGEFSYTFDSDDLSFEETAGIIANAVFCHAYRRGSTLRLFFERATEESSLLFNHRNKVPGSETRTITCGTEDDHDGIEYSYVSPLDDALITIYLPEDRSSRNPKKHESVGVRSDVQAHFHAWRLYNKLMCQRLAVEFTATQEAILLRVGDRILVANNTRSGAQDGEILSQNGLLVTTSQDVDLAPTEDSYAFLQLSDGTVQSIKVSQGSNNRTLILDQPPTLPLVHDASMYARTTYMLAHGDGNLLDLNAFLITEVVPDDKLTAQVSAINYDHRYYQNDNDYKTGKR